MFERLTIPLVNSMNAPEKFRSPEVLAFGPYRADAFARTLVHQAEGPIGLTPKQFDTLLLLLRHPGEVLDKERILATVWAGSVVEENNLSQAISALRKALGDDGETHRYILTVPRKGYRFVAAVAPVKTLKQASASAPLEGAAAEATETELPENQKAVNAPKVSTRLAQRRRVFSHWGWVVGGMALAAIAWTIGRPAPTASVLDRSVAVLPFANLSNGTADAYIGAGMTEDMVTQLAQVSGLKVVAHRDAGELPSLPDRALGKKLGAAHFLRGTVRRDAARLRISAQLIDADSGRHVWAKSYDRPMVDVLKVQSEVAAEIAGALAAVLKPAERAALGAYADGNAELHLQYREAMYLISRHKSITAQERQRGVAIFERLVKTFPESALGHAGLAAYYLRAPNLREVAFDEAYRRADRHIDAALRIDPNSGEALTMKAEVEARARWNWRAAAEAGARAVAVNPSSAEAWGRYALYGLKPLGRLDEAERAMRKALELEP
ncbi:MAG: winged helix-turn-helix domain-containing protein, partial [Betaproteobacteria bacterium]|nr:winged helix-turn-helix domain-containing protein [Betaproteobacteria bacterium]